MAKIKKRSLKTVQKRKYHDFFEEELN
jgi:hypothetical protein